MIAISMGLIWGGYTLIWWGWAMMHDWPVGLSQLVIPGKYPYQTVPPPASAGTGGGGATSHPPFPGMPLPVVPNKPQGKPPFPGGVIM